MDHLILAAMMGIGRILGDVYQLKKILGVGGWGTVYEAEHLLLPKKVAIKVIHPEYAESPEIKQRFVREANTSVQLKHRNVVAVENVVLPQVGEPYMVMELLEGENLDERLRRKGPMAVDQAVETGKVVLEVLQVAHAQGFVHRDIKPSNLFLARGDDGERLVVLDFGIAKAPDRFSPTASGDRLGTIPYMSPEQLDERSRADARSDVYSVGATLFDLLTGRPPVLDEDGTESHMHVERHPQDFRNDVPDWLDRVVAKAMAFAPERRFQSAIDMLVELERGAA